MFMAPLTPFEPLFVWLGGACGLGIDVTPIGGAVNGDIVLMAPLLPLEPSADV